MKRYLAALIILIAVISIARNFHGYPNANALKITTSSLTAANQFDTTHSQTLAATGGTPPYTWQLQSQSGYNPATWQLSSGGALTNLMPTLLNVETANLLIKVTDNVGAVVTETLPITVNRTVPAGAAAQGYTQLLFASRPTLSNIYFGTFGTVPGVVWSSGWPFTGTIPPAGLYSMSLSGVLQMTQAGTGTSPSATTPIITAAQLKSSGANAAAASTVPLIPAGNGYTVTTTLQTSTNDPLYRGGAFTFPTQHNVSTPYQDIDPGDGSNRRWLEKDTWEGSGTNGRVSGNWNGAMEWSGVYTNSNTTASGVDITLEHMYESDYIPSGCSINRYLDNVSNGSMVADSASSTALTTEQCAWVNGMTDFPMVAAFNDPSGTPYVQSVYEVSVWVPPLSITTTSPLTSAVSGTAYTTGSPLQTMAATGGGPPYTWTLTSQSGGSNTWAVSAAGVVTGTPSTAETDTLNIKVTDSTGVIVGPSAFTISVSSTGLLMPAANNVATNWQNAGLALAGGIPTRSTQCGSTVNPIGGSSDDYTNIQNAINACTAGDYVQLGSGTFNVYLADLPIAISTGISLRGTGNCTGNTSSYPAGVCSTQIVVYNGLQPYQPSGPQCGTSIGTESSCPNGGPPVISVSAPNSSYVNYNFSWAQCNKPGGNTGVGCGATPLTSDAAQGDTTIHVSSTANFSVGQWVLIDEASGATWQVDPDTANTGFGHVWGNADWAAASSGSTAPAVGRILFSKGETLPGTSGFNWDFGSGSYPYQTSSVGCYPYGYCDRMTSELHKVSAVNSGASTITFDDPLTIGYRVGDGTTFTGSVTNTSTTLSVSAGTAYIGQIVGGNACIPLGTYLASGSGASWTMNQAATCNASSVTLTSGDHQAQVYGPLYPNSSGTGGTVSFLTNAGVENLSILRGPNGILTFQLCAYCWAKNVEAGEFYNGGIDVRMSARVELNTVWVHHCWDSVNSGGEYPIAIDAASTEILLTNWITNFAGKGMVARGAGAGSVVSYGYQDDTMYDKYSGIGSYFVDMGVNGSHYTGSHHMLFEGNWGDNLDSDTTHGASTYQTYFRNQGTGIRTTFTDPSCSLSVNDQTQTGYTGTSCTTNTSGPLRAAGPMAYSYQDAFVGNVLGLSGVTTSGNGWTYQGDWNAKRIWMIGWWNFGTGGNDPNLTAANGTYIFRSGNYDYVTPGIALWASGYSTTLPNSLYLASAPSYMTGVHCTYPWPGVTPNGGSPLQSPTGGSCSSSDWLPAKARWDAGTPFTQP